MSSLPVVMTVKRFGYKYVSYGAPLVEGMNAHEPPAGGVAIGDPNLLE